MNPSDGDIQSISDLCPSPSMYPIKVFIAWARLKDTFL